MAARHWRYVQMLAASEVHAMFTRVHEAMGALSALVNNAGITGRIGAFMNTDSAIIENVFRINVHGTMHCSRATACDTRRDRRARDLDAVGRGFVCHRQHIARIRRAVSSDELILWGRPRLSVACRVVSNSDKGCGGGTGQS